MWVLEKQHKKNCNTQSDINQHLQFLSELASECKHITEFGVRTWISTISLLAWASQKTEIVSFDIEKLPEVDIIGNRVKQDKKHWTFIKHPTEQIIIDPTDMLFIDTLHDYSQLKMELRNNASRVRKYIVMHDTETFGIHWETEWKAWLWYAVEEFLLNHPERQLRNKFSFNNWLTVLRRIWDVDVREIDFKPTVCVYTAIYWNQDILKRQLPQSMDVDYICYTDNPDIECEPWARSQRKIIVEQPFKHLHPRMQAKRYRTHPEYNGDYRYNIRIDWTTRFKRMDTVEHLLSEFKQESDIICYKHDMRDCIYDEATYSQQFEKYKWQPMQAQVAYYKSLWMPEHFWLTWTWLLITRNTEYRVRDLLHERRAECLARTYQDQLSFDYLVWKYKIKRQRFQWPQFWDNKYVLFTWKHKHEK